MVSIRMMPSEVVTAQAEYSVWPTQYRLSKTLTGSAYHCERGGICLGVLAAGAFGAAGRKDVGEQTASNKPRCSWPAAARAAATCESTVAAVLPEGGRREGDDEAPAGNEIRAPSPGPTSHARPDTPSRT